MAAETDSPRSLRARWVFPVAGPPLKDAAVTIADGSIVSVGSPPRDAPVEDLGNVALLPGLVNAHTHLEFSDLAHPIGRPGIDFVEWVRSVIAHREASLTEAGGTAAIAMGLTESLRHGVTTIGEIAQPGQSLDVYERSPCDGTLFLELIAPRRDRVEAAVTAGQIHLEGLRLTSSQETKAQQDSYSVWESALSPHAPYTVHPELLAKAVALSNEFQVPLAMHLAESAEELEFLLDGSGPVRELLESRGAYDATARHRGSRPIDELRALSQAHRALIIHGNYLDADEIEALAWHHRRMAVVYCPRTHAWFDHAPYPLEQLLAAGAVVALGTDSRASSPDLSVLAEMRHVAQTFPAIRREAILELGTLSGARALGRDSHIGTLEPRMWANLTAVRLPEDVFADPHEWLLDADGPVAATWVRGECVFRGSSP